MPFSSGTAVPPKCQGLTFDAIIPSKLTDDSLPCFPSPQAHPPSKDFHTMLITNCTVQENPDFLPLAEQRQASWVATASLGAWERPLVAQFLLPSLSPG